ncbi:MAG: hypothetical protein KOO69_04725 [Victivallales bacterium]|nr:hypothetical protein [Victivallales bacterium]
MKKIILSIFTIYAFTLTAFASKEGVVQLSDFSIQSKGIGDSGPIIIFGKKNTNNHFINFKISAFGNEYNLSGENLKKIPPKNYNGILLTYERGYKRLGGRVIYILLQFGFLSGVKEKVLLTVRENGNITIQKNYRKYH